MDSDLDQCWSCKETGKFQCDSCKFAFYCSRKCQQTDRFRHEVECSAVQKRRKCIACGKSGLAFLDKCGNCFQVYYCDKACQRNDWPLHKSNCNKFKEETLFFADTPRTKPMDLPWYIGTSIAEDYLRLRQNEGSSMDKELHLLFVGVGDLRDVVRTIVDLPSTFCGKLNFVLNDIGPHVSARNFLFIYCAITNPESFEHLVHIWYSLYLIPATLKFLASKLKELTTTSYEDTLKKMNKHVIISIEHWVKFVAIWQGWYKLALDPDAADRMMEVRHKKFSVRGAMEGMKCLYMSIPQQHVPSMKDFMKQGLLLPLRAPERRDALFPNCTMACFNPHNPKHARTYTDIGQEAIVAELYIGQNILTPEEDMIYGVRSDAHIFNCWDYVVVKDTVGMKDDLLQMYLSYLKRTFRTFAEKVNAGPITFKFIIDDFRNVKNYLCINDTFDRISVSNVTDYYFYPLLLKHFGSLLNKDNPCSVLISHHENWPKLTGVYDQVQYGPPDAVNRAKKDLATRKEVLPGVRDKLVINYLCCSEDYFDTTPYFLQFLMGESAAYLIQHEKQLPAEKQLIHPARMGQKFGLCLRDFGCKLNHVVPFTREGNTRRVSIQMNNKRYLEWTLSCETAP